MGLLFFTMANWSTPLCIQGHKTNKQQFAFVLHICKARSMLKSARSDSRPGVARHCDTTVGNSKSKPLWLQLIEYERPRSCWDNREAQSLLQTNCQTNSNYCLKWYRAAPGYKLHHLQPSRTSWPQDYRPGRKSRSESCENWTSASLPHLLLSNIGLTHIWHRNLIDGTHIPQTWRTMSLLTQCQIPLSVPSTADWVQRDLDATSVFSWHLWPGWSSFDNIQFQSLKFKTPLMLSICLFLLLQEQQHCNPHAFIMVLDDVWEQNWFETKTQKILSAEFEKATSPGRHYIQFDWRDCRLHHGRHLEIKMLVHEPELKVFKLWKKIKINSK